MIWRRFGNEIFLLAALLLALTGFLYKKSSIAALERTKNEVTASMVQIDRIAALQEQWGNEKLDKSISRLKEGIAPQKIKTFTIKSRKLDALFQGLSEKELGQALIKIENTPVQIVHLGIHHSEENYNLEVTCKW